MGPEGRSVFEEGMYIPIIKCFDQGKPNETFFDFMRAGSRLPVELEGDIYSLCACNDAGAQPPGRDDGRVRDGQSRSAGTVHLRQFASRHTGGNRAYSARATTRPRSGPTATRNRCGCPPRWTSSTMAIEVDFAGTSGLSSRGINVPPAYCRAYSCFGIKCVVAPEIPNNWASLAPFRMKIPGGLHPERAAALSRSRFAM